MLLGVIVLVISFGYAELPDEISKLRRDLIDEILPVSASGLWVGHEPGLHRVVDPDAFGPVRVDVLHLLVGVERFRDLEVLCQLAELLEPLCCSHPLLERVAELHIVPSIAYANAAR